VAQDLTQIHAAYGREEAVTINCDTLVAFAPNKIQTAQELSKFVGETTVRHAQRTVSSGGTSVSEPEVGRPLITPDEVRRLGEGEVLVLPRGQHAIRAERLQYHAQEFFKRRAAIGAPKTSDRINTAGPSSDGREKGRAARVAAAISSEGAERPGEDLAFLRYGANRESREELV
jgi:type IV secretion system protein VirD4